MMEVELARDSNDASVNYKIRYLIKITIPSKVIDLQHHSHNIHPALKLPASA